MNTCTVNFQKLKTVILNFEYDLFHPYWYINVSITFLTYDREFYVHGAVLYGQWRWLIYAIWVIIYRTPQRGVK